MAGYGGFVGVGIFEWRSVGIVWLIIVAEVFDDGWIWVSCRVDLWSVLCKIVLIVLYGFLYRSVYRFMMPYYLDWMHLILFAI